MSRGIIPPCQQQPLRTQSLATASKDDAAESRVAHWRPLIAEPISRVPLTLASRPLKTSLRARAKGKKKRPQSAEDPGEDRIEARRSAA